MPRESLSDLKVGVKPHQLGATYEELRRAWQEASDSGFESLWLFDHFVPPKPGMECMEAWTLLAAMAAQVPGLRCGVMVTGIAYRHPAILASMAATVDHISGGRLEVGLGAGSDFGRTDLEAFGMPFPPLRERAAMLREACEVILRLWREDTVDFQGRFFQLRGATCGARPLQEPHPPLIVGGKSDPVLRVAAEFAQGWNYSGDDPQDFKARCRRLDGLCSKIGRDPRSVERSVQMFLRSLSLERLGELVTGFRDAGARRIILIPDPPYERGKIRRLGEWVRGILDAL
jgi:alkanesulfonate monooxygenase SsuD/methylene tetrahydromethanopterin reductase-like flavin-dependent oxidoreductase (luciferase family)